ncbi:hypothetical protein BDF22DRAFT_747218 [Syncephalis plumigaleata]|nr:hypothetical protein BDF22DRAFT_747218 [Syncephalis plumigaleata]
MDDLMIIAYIQLEIRGTQPSSLYADIWSCGNSTAMYHIALVSIIISAIGLMATLVVLWLRYQRRHLARSPTEQVAFWFARFIFFITIISGAIETYYMLKSVLHALCWPSAFVAALQYTTNIIIACPPPNLTERQMHIRRRNLHRLMWTGIVTTCVSTITAAVFTGKFRDDQHYDAEIIATQIYLVIYSVGLFTITAVVWRFGIKIQRLVRQRAAIAEQFNSRERVSMTGGIAQRLSSTANNQSVKLEVSLQGSAARMYIINQCLFWGSIVLGVVLAAYAVITRQVFENAVLYATIGFIINVGGMSSVVMTEVYLAVGLYRKDKRPYADRTSQQKLAKPTGMTPTCSIELPALEYPNWTTDHADYIVNGSFGLQDEVATGPDTTVVPSAEITGTSLPTLESLSGPVDVPTIQMTPRPIHVTFINRMDE